VLWLIAITGCGGGGSNNDNALKKVGPGEGKLNLIAWAGYVEDPWKSDFQKQTGCKVNAKVGGTSDEMIQLMRTGQYDGVSASGNATARLVDGKDVSPVNVDLVPNYKTVFADLKNQPYNTFDGTNYGVPHGRGANLLMWRSDKVTPAPTSWDVVLDPAKAAKYKGSITAYDDPIYIADAALYLKSSQPDLGIDNPYELDAKQFAAATDLLKKQRPNVGEYWSDPLKQISAFTNGDDLVGTTWQYQYLALKDKGVPVAASPASQGFLPKEGATGWSDTWMISSKAAHPNCMYKWMDFIVSPKANAEVAQYFGEAPSQSKSCSLTDTKKFCDDYHAGDPGFWKRVAYWQTPLRECGDSRGAVCKDYNDWVHAWTAIKG
jgi:putative spermidine/putrescine transport system substrate-binding protein